MGILETSILSPRDLSSLNTLKQHGLSLAEVKISQVSAAKGQLLSNIRLPKQTRVLAVLRGNELLTDLHAVFVEEGDTIFLLSNDETVVRSVFTI